MGSVLAIMPASNNLFEKGNGKLLDIEKKEIFHHVVAKGLFILNRSRPDMIPMVSILLGRVREPNKHDWGKGLRLFEYLKDTLIFF